MDRSGTPTSSLGVRPRVTNVCMYGVLVQAAYRPLHMSPLPRKEEGSLALAKRGLAGVSIGDSQLGYNLTLGGRF